MDKTEKVKIFERLGIPIIKCDLLDHFRENKILLMIPYCKVYEHFIDTCVKSVLNQKYNNFEIMIINDGDENFDRTYDKSKILYYNHRFGNGPGASKYHFIKYLQDNYNDFHDETIVAIVDGDDYLTTKSALTLVNLHYNINHSLMSCGNYEGRWNNNIRHVKSYLDDPNVRMKQDFYSVRTFKMKLVNYINVNDLIYTDGKFIQRTSDKVLFVRMIEQRR